MHIRENLKVMLCSVCHLTLQPLWYILDPSSPTQCPIDVLVYTLSSTANMSIGTMSNIIQHKWRVRDWGILIIIVCRPRNYISLRSEPLGTTSHGKSVRGETTGTKRWGHTPIFLSFCHIFSLFHLSPESSNFSALLHSHQWKETLSLPGDWAKLAVLGLLKWVWGLV